jgi:hypothetical protein
VRFVAAFLVLTGHAAGIMRFPGPPPCALSELGCRDIVEALDRAVR